MGKLNIPQTFSMKTLNGPKWASSISLDISIKDRFSGNDDFPANSLFQICETACLVQKMNMKQSITGRGGRIQVGKARLFPVYSRLSGKSAETGSQQTAHTAIHWPVRQAA
jgi:hypothetical protein